jgi:hypothetical protein
MLKRPSNLSRTNLQLAAKCAIETHGGPDVARVWYKFDCGNCGIRCVAPDPNVLPAMGTCATCGTETRILGGGYALEVRRSRFVPWDKVTNALVVRQPYESDRGDA